MADQLNDVRVAILTANEGVERVELTEPRRAFTEAGASVTLVAPKAGDVQTFDHLDKAAIEQATAGSGDVTVDDYDALVLPGGVANPDQLRTDAASVALVAAFFEAGKPVAAICHAPWTLIEAGVVAGRTLTSWPSLQTDVRNAGGTWVDQEVVVCDHGANLLVTSRKPDDLPRFCEAAVGAFARGQRTEA